MGRKKTETDRKPVQITRVVYQDHIDEMAKETKETGKTSTAIIRESLDHRYNLPKKKEDENH